MGRKDVLKKVKKKYGEQSKRRVKELTLQLARLLDLDEDFDYFHNTYTDMARHSQNIDNPILKRRYMIMLRHQMIGFQIELVEAMEASIRSMRKIEQKRDGSLEDYMDKRLKDLRNRSAHPGPTFFGVDVLLRKKSTYAILSRIIKKVTNILRDEYGLNREKIDKLTAKRLERTLQYDICQSRKYLMSTLEGNVNRCAGEDSGSKNDNAKEAIYP